MIKTQVEEDVWDWIKNYIETNHKFYNYKFPPCPYAKSARLKGLVSVNAYTYGGIFKFIRDMATSNAADNQHSVMVLVLPPRSKMLTWFLSRFIKNLNKTLVTQDYYAQYGVALTSKSKYKGWFNSGEYSIVIINKLSEILDGHNNLLNTDYYKPWSLEHYEAVVSRRQHTHTKYKI